MSRFGRQRSRGQALAEFALVMPIFAVLLFGIIDVGRLVYTQNTLNNAAREAARGISVSKWPPVCNGMTAGTQRGTCAIALARSQALGVSGVTDIVVTCSSVGNNDANGDGTLDSSTVASTSTNPAGSSGAWQTCAAGDLVKVSTSSAFTLVTPVISSLIGTPTLKGEAQVTVSSS